MSQSTRRAILSRHESSLTGRLRGCFIRSRHLGVTKPFYIYEPPGLENYRELSTLYLFRGHEREWVNFYEDSSRNNTTAIEDLDRAIVLGLIPPMLAVMPGLNSSDNHIPSLGIDMAGPIDPTKRGLGSGRFWHYLDEELFPRIERSYPQTVGGRNVGAGFSLGGYTVSLLASQKPGFFNHVGIYDGLFMWPDHQDPRVEPEIPYNDRVWTENPLFDAAFGLPRSTSALANWNPTDALINAPASMNEALRRTTWWIACASEDGSKGNRDRAEFIASIIAARQFRLGFDTVFFDEQAAHTWHWTDRFLIHFLKHAMS